MNKNFTFLILLISITCYTKNSRNSIKLFSKTTNDSIYICPFPNNCGYYKGDIVNGKANGKGRAKLNKGIAEGEWKNNRLNGYGTFNTFDGIIYTGEFIDGKASGQGIQTFKDIGKYVGKWKNNKFDGQGTITYHDGTNYVGQWKEGKKMVKAL